jgi:hypothetical protein
MPPCTMSEREVSKQRLMASRCCVLLTSSEQPVVNLHTSVRCFAFACMQAAMIDSWNVSDIQTDKVFRDIAEQQLGPILEVSWVLGFSTGLACRVLNKHKAGWC